MAYTRRQELFATEAEMKENGSKVLLAKEILYVKMNSGVIRAKMGDGTTTISKLPFMSVFDGTVVTESGDSKTLAASQKQVTDATKKDSVNLFNKNTAHLGVYVNYLTGTTSDAANYFASDFIPIDGSKEYYISYYKSNGDYVHPSSALQFAFYDETFTYISGLAHEWKFTTPENAKYIRFTLDKSIIDVAMLTEIIPMKNYPYADKIVFDYDMIDFPVVVGVKSPNIVNPNKLINGYYIDYTSGKAKVNEEFSVTPYIKIDGKTKLYSNTNATVGYTQVAFYNDELYYISGEHHVTYAGVSIPENAKYVRCSVMTSSKRMYSFEPIEKYIPYGAYINEAKTNVLTVKLDGTGDFDNLRTCFESITDANATNPYIVEIYEGTYDIKSYYTDEEWAVENNAVFRGLYVPNYVTLRGVGRKERIILTASDTTYRDYISTLNLRDTCSLENLTVKGEYLRYVIHDDSAKEGSSGYTRRVENCDFIGKHLTLACAYGAGLEQGANATFKNCTFQAGKGFRYHNNINWTIPSYITFENCRFGKEVRLGSLNTNANEMLTYATFIGCKGDLLKIDEDNASKYGSGILFKVTGYANDFTDIQIISTDGVDHSDKIDLV